MNAWRAWRLAKVRAWGRGTTYVRWTPDFAVQVKIGKRLYYYGTRKGFRRRRV